MSNVIDMFGSRKKPTPTIEELAKECGDELCDTWQRFARNNRLNDFFISSVPSSTQASVDYLSNISAISLVESKLGMAIILNAPGTSESSKIGWVASFIISGVVIETPVMMCEAYARCFNILLFLKLARACSTHGISY